MRFHQIILPAALTLTACQVGKNAGDLPIAHAPVGVTLALNTAKGKMEGELLEMRDDGAVVFLNDGRVALVTWEITNSATAKTLDQRYHYGYRMPPKPDVRANLRLVSHFPQGMTPEIEARYLASKGQRTLVILRW